jgi:hypothetical protein
MRGFERGLVGAGGDRCERLDARDDDRCGEARRDAGGDIEWCCAGGDFADGAVRKLDLDMGCSSHMRIVHSENGSC